MASFLAAQVQHQNQVIVLRMTVNGDGNVLLALAYGVGYALCDRNSAVQWAWRASMAFVSVVLYVMSGAWDHGALLVLAVAIVSDLCDGHRDALGLTQCLIGTAAVGLMVGSLGIVVDLGEWLPTMTSVGMALLVPHRGGGLPSLDALAVVLAATVPVDPVPHEACARVLGLWLVLYWHGDAAHRVALHKVVHLVVAPWPAACVVAMAQIGLVTKGFGLRRRSSATYGDGAGLAPTVMV